MEIFNSMYFDVSLIFKKSKETEQKTIQSLADKFNLQKGENSNSIFGQRKIIVFKVDDSIDTDFSEICIDFSEQTFNKATIQEDIQFFEVFVKECFASNEDIKFALCSYELNGHLISKIKTMEEIDDEFLGKFPLAFKRREDNINIQFYLNLDAQDIF